jgi:isoprenylcysteine carboxyl methyltransferase (ICMT) family protein YpbQ
MCFKGIMQFWGMSVLGMPWNWLFCVVKDILFVFRVLYDFDGHCISFGNIT